MAASERELQALRQQVAAARTRLKTLQDGASSLDAVPGAAPSLGPRPASSSAPAPNLSDPLASQLEAAQEHARRYRLTGWSCWEVELTKGRYALQKVEADGGKARKGLAVRIETFWRGRFYEPYYVVFAFPAPAPTKGTFIKPKPDQNKRRAKRRGRPPKNANTISDAAANGEVATGQDGRQELSIEHHTIPHFVPLADLEADYLSGPEADVELFLTRLTTLLQAFVSRRQQILALTSAPPPNSDLALEGDDSYQNVRIAWRVSDEGGGGKDVVVEVRSEGPSSDWFGVTGPGSGAWISDSSIEDGLGPVSDRRPALERTHFPPRPSGSLLTGELRGLDRVVSKMIEETRRPGWA